MSIMITCILLYLKLFVVTESFSPVFDRPGVIKDGANDTVFFRTTQPGAIYATSLKEGQLSGLLSLNKMQGIGSLYVTSNPVGVDGFGCFAMASDGQVYLVTPSFSVSEVGLGKLPVTLDPKKFSVDPVQAVNLENLHTIFVFVRSQTNSSLLYYCYANTSIGKLSWSKWSQIGDSTPLEQDPFAATNSFLGHIEIFVVLQGGILVHTWQTGETQFTEGWHKFVLFPPKFNSTPVAHAMSHSDFNGVLQVFARGTDGNVHYISQTICDKLKNPWGPCTWDIYFDKLEGALPASSEASNPLVVSQNIHLGLEVFVVGKDKELYRSWQAERDKKWSKWELVGFLSGSRVPYNSTPAIVNDEVSWWEGIAVGPNNIVYRYAPPRSFALNDTKVAFGHNVSVRWSVPIDEATSKDWIGVFQQGTSDQLYLNYKYVGGEQNPLAYPVPKGQIDLELNLPNGKYDVRYLVNKEYVAVLNSTLSVFNATSEVEWIQLYRGIAEGLGIEAFDFEKCVEDGNLTVATFRDAFIAFEEREIIKGLHLFAQGLTDFRDALVVCDETAIVQALTKFITDLISCTEGQCEKFVIDIATELFIFYERRYEIYGDIKGATNCFKIDAYEQAGVCIGHVTAACIEKPDLQ